MQCNAIHEFITFLDSQGAEQKGQNQIQNQNQNERKVYIFKERTKVGGWVDDAIPSTSTSSSYFIYLFPLYHNSKKLCLQCVHCAAQPLINAKRRV